MPTAAEGSHLHDLATEIHMGQSESPPDQATIAEHPAHLLGRGIRSHIEILGLPTQQQIPHPTADQIGLIASLPQAVKYLERILADVGA